ncbi:histidine kinase [Blastococcus sp. CCUG 61487]|nr:histidine kinase [Blastococcus sp. CCUG 61487]
MAAAVLAATTGGQLDSTLGEILRAAVSHVDAAYGALGILSCDGARLERFVVEGMTEETHERIGRLPTGQGVLSVLVSEPSELRLDDLTAHPAHRGFPEGHPPMHSFLGVPVRVGDTVFGHLYLTEKRTGSGFTEADAEIARALAAVAGLAIDNARLLERAERRRAWAQAGTETSNALLSGVEPDQVLDTAAGRLAELCGAEIAAVLVPMPGDDDSLWVEAAVGPSASDTEGVRIPLVGGRLWEAHRTGVPALLSDFALDVPEGYPPGLLGDISGDYGPAVLIPVGGPPAQGTIALARRRESGTFPPDVLELASAFAGQATVALELVRSQERERRLQRQADRERIARDLHDHVVQRIFATALAVDRIARSLESEAPEVAARLAERVDELDGTIARIRTSIFELQHEDTASGGVRARLAEVVRSVVDGHGLHPDLRVAGEVEDLPADLVPDLVAAVRELVTNVLRHAGASRVTISVTATDALRARVTDDGGGLPAITVRSGLANLADRAARRGGRLAVDSGPSGTDVEWSVPLPGTPPG